MTSIEDSLRDILIDNLFVERQKEHILTTLSFRRDLGVDSLGFVELKEQVEKRFGIDISDDDFTPENFSNIDSLSSFIQQKAGASSVRQQ